MPSLCLDVHDRASWLPQHSLPCLQPKTPVDWFGLSHSPQSLARFTTAEDPRSHTAGAHTLQQVSLGWWSASMRAPNAAAKDLGRDADGDLVKRVAVVLGRVPGGLLLASCRRRDVHLHVCKAITNIATSWLPKLHATPRDSLQRALQLAHHHFTLQEQILSWTLNPSSRDHCHLG